MQVARVIALRKLKINGFRGHDLRLTRAMFYKLSDRATEFGEGQFSGLGCSHEMNL